MIPFRAFAIRINSVKSFLMSAKIPICTPSGNCWLFLSHWVCLPLLHYVQFDLNMLMPHANTVKHRVLRTGGHATAPENRTDQARVIPKTNKTRVVDHCAFWEPGDWVSIQKKKKNQHNQNQCSCSTLWLFSVLLLLLLLVNFLRNGDQHKSVFWMRMCADCKSHSHCHSDSDSSTAECRQQLYRLQQNWTECWHTVHTGLWRRPAANICTRNVFNTHRHHQVSILINYNYSCQELRTPHPHSRRRHWQPPPFTSAWGAWF